MVAKSRPTVIEVFAGLAAVTRYDPETGLVWYTAAGPKRKLNKPAGTLDSSTGYVQLNYKGRLVYAHRMAHYHMTGRVPVAVIDHVDGNKQNNAWNNLREATVSQNLANSKRRADNKTGYKGVFYEPSRGKYRANIRVLGKTKHLGRYLTPEEAHAAYTRAAKAIFGDYHREN